jgi:putative ABC transport system permease protein
MTPSRTLFEVRPTEPVVYAAVSALLLVVALLASFLPARRAARIDPVIALRAE